jgi:NADPH2:quinone reductase
MQAIRFHRHGGPEVLRLEDVPVPEPAAGELLVRVEAAGVNYADTVRRWGDHYPVPTPLPAIAGAEFAGTVARVGSGVDPAWIGARVIAAPPGSAYAQWATVPESLAYRLPAGLHAHQALALFIQGLSAALILRLAARMRPGDHVLVQGAAGGVGSLGVQLAKLYGAGKVFGAASTAEKRARVLSLGADRAIDYSAPGWSAQIRDETAGHGADVVMEMTGGDVFAESLGCLAPGGRIAVYGIASRKPFAVPSERLISKGQTVTGFYLGAYLRDRPLVEATLAELAQFQLAGQLRVEASTVMPLAAAADAHRLIESRQSTAKIVLVPPTGDTQP